MIDPGVTFETGRCSDCPFVKLSMEQYAMLDELAARALDQAFDQITPEAAEQIYTNVFEGRSIARVTDEGIKPIESAEDMFTAMREGSEQFIERLDEARASIQESVANMTSRCGGGLKMRASKAGQVVTATVCMAGAEMENGETKVEPVVIDRREA